MRKVGVGLVVAAYVLLLYSALSVLMNAREHTGHELAHYGNDPAILAEYAAPWPVALGCALSIAGIMLAIVPVRRGERWAIWTSLTMLLVLLAARLATDPRCLVVLDPNQHGCHTFMIAVVLGFVGLGLAGFGGHPASRPTSS